MAARPPVSRLLVSDATAAKVERTRIQITSTTGREWTKTAIHDAMIEVAIEHLDEVMSKLASSGGTPS
ncbi:hypothetical protein ACWENQ_45590 [Nonomuraea sp. NPDC004354]